MYGELISSCWCLSIFLSPPQVAVQRKRYGSAALCSRIVGSVDVLSRPARSAPVLVLGLDLALLSAPRWKRISVLARCLTGPDLCYHISYGVTRY
jgi:hypothetical protein